MDNTNPVNPPMPPASPAASPSPMPAKKEVRIPIASLPPGTKAGDYIELCIDSIDEATKMAIASPESDNDGDEDDQQESGGEDDKPEQSDESLDTKTLLGPMDGLKNYLIQKSVDVPKNQGRS